MRTELDHLPEDKRRDLERIVAILFAEFDEATGIATRDWKRTGRILKIVLYGSHARGDWVSDAKGGYFSDYDILVVVSDRRLTDTLEFWAKADDHLLRAVSIEKSISAPVNFIVHDLNDVNDQLHHGRPFFVDIARDGIALYEFEGCEFDQPRALTKAKRQLEAKRYYDKWFPSAKSFASMARHAISEGSDNEAAFAYHQATERFYHAVLLVLTLYSPKSHKLNFLRSQAESHAPDLIQVWPRDTRFAQRSFELLRRAYVDARYSPHYKISPEELEWLGDRIELLQNLVRETCERQVAQG